MAKFKSKKEKHPLYGSWAWMRRMHSKFAVCEEWYSDFYKFVEDMGERPDANHRVNRVDSTQGFSPDNCKWKQVIPSGDKAAYAREWRKQNPDKAKSIELKKMFGITFDDYKVMLEEQNGVCKICGGEEKYNTSLAVDHCHATGKVRGLLCTMCNTALGKFKDDPKLLQNAINYLS